MNIIQYIFLLNLACLITMIIEVNKMYNPITKERRLIMADQMRPFEGYVDGGIYVRISIDKNSIVTFMFSEDKNGIIPADISGRCATVFAAIATFGDLNPDFKCMTTIVQGTNYFISRYSRIL